MALFQDTSDRRVRLLGSLRQKPAKFIEKGATPKSDKSVHFVSNKSAILMWIIDD
jgi:hypothetical protein